MRRRRRPRDCQLPDHRLACAAIQPDDGPPERQGGTVPAYFPLKLSPPFGDRRVDAGVRVLAEGMVLALELSELVFSPEPA